MAQLRSSFVTSLGVAFAALTVVPAVAEARPETPEAWLELAAEELCAGPEKLGFEAERALPGVWLLEERIEEDPQGIAVVAQRFALPGEGELRIRRVEPGGQLRRFTAEFYRVDGEDAVPVLQGIAGASCVYGSARRIRREGEGRAVLQQLEGDLETLRWSETLEAPWPEGSDPGGPRVGLVDSGLAYDLPLYSDRLARDAEGTPLGFDYWDMDPWPYDGDTSRGPFLPIRHGSAVASVLVREAPAAVLVPFRYPRPEMARMGELVDRAAAAGVRVLAMPLGSRDPEDWTAFAEALLARPQILAIVSAGNDGQNIDESDLWPAVLELPNMIVVTSADGFGRLAPGSNWGPESVDLMLPAENVPVVDFRGASGTASGSSYAVPRLAALAVRILAERPDLPTEDLVTEIYARAVPSPYEDNVVAVGWIPDPLAR